MKEGVEYKILATTDYYTYAFISTDYHDSFTELTDLPPSFGNISVALSSYSSVIGNLLQASAYVNVLSRTYSKITFFFFPEPTTTPTKKKSRETHLEQRAHRSTLRLVSSLRLTSSCRAPPKLRSPPTWRSWLPTSKCSSTLRATSTICRVVNSRSTPKSFRPTLPRKPLSLTPSPSTAQGPWLLLQSSPFCLCCFASWCKHGEWKVIRCVVLSELSLHLSVAARFHELIIIHVGQLRVLLSLLVFFFTWVTWLC